MDDLPPRGDDRFCLLPSQHHLRDFGRIGEMHQPGFVDHDPGFRESLLQLNDQRAGNELAPAEQRRLEDATGLDVAVVVGKR